MSVEQDVAEAFLNTVTYDVYDSYSKLSEEDIRHEASNRNLSVDRFEKVVNLVKYAGRLKFGYISPIHSVPLADVVARAEPAYSCCKINGFEHKIYFWQRVGTNDPWPGKVDHYWNELPSILFDRLQPSATLNMPEGIRRGWLTKAKAKNALLTVYNNHISETSA